MFSSYIVNNKTFVMGCYLRYNCVNKFFTLQDFVKIHELEKKSNNLISRMIPVCFSG